MSDPCLDRRRAPRTAHRRLAGAALIAIVTTGSIFADEPATATGAATEEAEGNWIETSTTRFVPEWGLSLILREKAPEQSDFFLHSFRLESPSGEKVAESPWMYGPILISRPNRQVVVCEGNGIDQGENILFFDLTGSETARVAHLPAFLSDCGTIGDEQLYWFFSVGEETAGTESVLRGTFVVLDRDATEVARRSLEGPGVVRFEWNGASYERSFESLRVPP